MHRATGGANRAQAFVAVVGLAVFHLGAAVAAVVNLADGGSKRHGVSVGLALGAKNASVLFWRGVGGCDTDGTVGGGKLCGQQVQQRAHRWQLSPAAGKNRVDVFAWQLPSGQDAL